MSSEGVLGSVTSPTAPPLSVSRCMSENQACRCGCNTERDYSTYTQSIAIAREHRYSERKLCPPEIFCWLDLDKLSHWLLINRRSTYGSSPKAVRTVLLYSHDIATLSKTRPHLPKAIKFHVISVIINIKVIMGPLGEISGVRRP